MKRVKTVADVLVIPDPARLSRSDLDWAERQFNEHGIDVLYVSEAHRYFDHIDEKG